MSYLTGWKGRRQVTASPDVNAVLRRALSIHQTGDIAAAEPLYRQVIELDPDQAQALHYLGLIVHQRGRESEAIALLRRAVTANPDDASGWNNLGNMLKGKDRLPEAVDAYREVVRLIPDHANGLNNLALTLLDMGETAESVALFRQALRHQPQDAEMWNSLGEALAVDGQLDTGKEAFLTAIRLDSKYPDAYNNLGLVYMDQGDFEQATVQYRKALSLDPHMPGALVNLARSKYITVDDRDDISAMVSALRREDLDNRGRAQLHFALGKVHDNCGAYEKAFEHYRLGNDVRGRELRFDADQHTEFVTRIIATFSSETFQRSQGYGSNSEQPVFVVGMPRSGSSLIEQIIASHPQAKGAGELGLITDLCTHLPNALGTKLEYPECIIELGMESTRQLAAGYLRELIGAVGDAVRITDKALANFLHLGLIALLFPRARVVHCRRDARDVALSNYFQLFAVGHYFSYRLDDFASYYQNYVRLMDHWRNILPLEIHDVVYEELVEDHEGVSRALIEYCGCAWDEACLSFHRTSRPVQTASNWEVRQPLYQRSVGRWRHYEKHLPDVIRFLG